MSHLTLTPTSGWALAFSLLTGVTLYLRYRATPTSVDQCKPTYPDLTSREKTLTCLRSGQSHVLSWAEYGPETGNPILFFHGLPGSRVIPVPQLKDLCEKANVRVISVEAPGIGKAGFLLEKGDNPITIQNAAISEVLLPYLGIEGPIPVVGYSLGGPRAVGFLHAHPSRVSSLFLIATAGFSSSIPPKSVEVMCPENAIAFTICRHFPSFLRVMWSAIASHLVQAENYVYNFSQSTLEVDKKHIANAEVKGLWVTTANECFRQGIQGMLEYVLAAFGKDEPCGWGFDVREAGAHPVNITLYHGKKDAISPSYMSVGLAAVLQQKRSTEWDNVSVVLLEEEGHFSGLDVALGLTVKQVGGSLK